MSNLYQKVNYEDHFARRYYCQHARLNYSQFIKKYNNKRIRQKSKNLSMAL